MIENVYATNRFLDKQFISNGVYHLNDRYYSQSLGRFLTQDPKKSISSEYGYVKGNPIMESDPTGLSPVENELSVVFSNIFDIPESEPTILKSEDIKIISSKHTPKPKLTIPRQNVIIEVAQIEHPTSAYSGWNASDFPLIGDNNHFVTNTYQHGQLHINQGTNLLHNPPNGFANDEFFQNLRNEMERFDRKRKIIMASLGATAAGTLIFLLIYLFTK